MRKGVIAHLLLLFCLLVIAGQPAQATPPSDPETTTTTLSVADSFPEIPPEPSALGDAEPKAPEQPMTNATLVGKDALTNWLNLLLVTGLMLITLTFVSIRKAVKNRRS